ncbi:hypothetical protein [Roseomonas sp. BN140053]|uniref:hypothetical protein n=1 Tax=Roseomonas sp. BN140053 TaxID=3391898 RepID=UPI0039E979A6
MATLASLTAAETADPEGDWIAPGGDADDIEVRTVGFSDAYTDAQARRHRRLAQAYGGDVTAVPVALMRKANLDCLLQHSVFGLRNLKGEDGQDLPFEEVKRMVYEPRFRPLADAMFAAARLATARRKADIEDAEGNSERLSGNTSNGASTPT